MKLGIIGLSGAGKSTVFEALTRTLPNESGYHAEQRIGTIPVPDSRVDVLSRMYEPKKTIYAQVEYFLPGKAESPQKNIWNDVRDCDALIQVVRNFKGFGLDAPTPDEDIRALEEEMVLSDLVVVEKRLERIELDMKRGKKDYAEEAALLKECQQYLEQETPLRAYPEIVKAVPLKGFAFISAKPVLILLNNEDDDDQLPQSKSTETNKERMIIRGKLEHELSQMTDEDAAEFLKEYQITASAMDRVIQKSYDILGLISFFTVGKDEVRAWTIKKDTLAPDAAEVIHSDIKKGFIRAEVVAYEDLLAVGNYQEAKKKGTVRLEGKTYVVQNGDIINFRFNV